MEDFFIRRSQFQPRRAVGSPENLPIEPSGSEKTFKIPEPKNSFLHIASDVETGSQTPLSSRETPVNSASPSLRARLSWLNSDASARIKKYFTDDTPEDFLSREAKRPRTPVDFLSQIDADEDQDMLVLDPAPQHKPTPFRAPCFQLDNYQDSQQILHRTPSVTPENFTSSSSSTLAPFALENGLPRLSFDFEEPATPMTQQERAMTNLSIHTPQPDLDSLSQASTQESRDHAIRYHELPPRKAPAAKKLYLPDEDLGAVASSSSAFDDSFLKKKKRSRDDVHALTRSHSTPAVSTRGKSKMDERQRRQQLQEAHKNQASVSRSISVPAPQDDVCQIHEWIPYLKESIRCTNSCGSAIPPFVLAKLITGAMVLPGRSLTIIDCRFEWEFQGGHIPNAININSVSDLENRIFNDEGLRYLARPDEIAPIIIFHCEFSLSRGPALARHIRTEDRLINRYPKMFFPEIYVLEGGYKKFYAQFKHLCTPSEYVRMRHENFETECVSEMRRFQSEIVHGSCKF